MRFDFGKNWIEYSQNALSESKIEDARKDFCELMRGIELENKSFLDIGFGQGMALFFAHEKGAIVSGNDINPKCMEAVKIVSRFFDCDRISSIQLVLGNILLEKTIRKLMASSRNNNGYDIVHSWGVLHHTGDMWLALNNAAKLVKPGGYLVIAIYNKHWSSKLWKVIKKTYCRSNEKIKILLICILFYIIWLAKFLISKKNPRHKERGMDFHYDVIDWIGGYPYEYANKDEIESFLTRFGFQLKKIIPESTPTGCCQFIFHKRKRSQGTASAALPGT